MNKIKIIPGYDEYNCVILLPYEDVNTGDTIEIVGSNELRWVVKLSHEKQRLVMHNEFYKELFWGASNSDNGGSGLILLATDEGREWRTDHIVGNIVSNGPIKKKNTEMVKDFQMNNEEIKFNRPELQKAFDETRSYLENSKEYMNNISSDIQQLEKILKALNLKSDCFYQIQRTLVCSIDRNNYDSYSHRLELLNSEERIIMILSALQWDFSQKRLMYMEHIYEGDETIVNISFKPAVECAFLIKKRIHKILPNYMRKISEIVSNEGIK